MLLAISFDQARQLFASGIANGASYGLLGVAFALILGVTGRMHFAFGVIYTLTGYIAYTFVDSVGWPFWPSVAVAVLLAPVIGVAVERFVYRPLAQRAGDNALLAVFVAALGISIAGENLIRLVWGSQTNGLLGWRVSGVEILGANLINIDIFSIGVSLLLVLGLTGLLRFTGLGRAIKATRSNPEMALLVGVDPQLIYLTVFAIGTFLAGVGAIFNSVKFSVEPSMGFRPVVLAFVVAFFGGTASPPIRVFAAGIVVGLIESMSSLWVSVRWTQITVFAILLIYLISLSVELPKPSRKPMKVEA